MNTLDRSQPPPAGAVRTYEFPAVERDTLPNGLTVLTAQHGIMPLVTGRVVLAAGATREAAEVAGVAQLVAHTIDTGTVTKDARQLSWELELLGAQLEVSTGFDGTAISVTAPADQMSSALALLAEILLDARFPESEVQRVRNEQLGEIAQRRSDPRSLAADQAVRFIYGPAATYGRSVLGRQETVQRLTAGDVRAFYQDQYAARGAALILTGSRVEEVRGAALPQLARWAAGQPLNGTAAAAPGSTRPPPGIHIVNRPGSVQSEIRIGHPGPTRADPDYFALQVMNSILGGAFTSRLNMNLREKHGFTYGVRSSFSFRKGPGPFLISTAVASDATARAIEEILKEVDALRAQGPTDQEMADTRDYLAGILPLELQTTHQLAGKLSELFLYALPDDYFSTYRERIAAVTREDARRVAQQHIAREQFTFVVVGDAAQIEASLRALGLGSLAVHNLDE